jgi:CMP-N-acetylneuraminic acid synthetase
MRNRVTAFVPIRLNSKRLLKKNLLPIGGHPLCWYIFNNLLKVKKIDEVYVFCSDKKIMDYVPNGVKILIRDSYLDGDLVKGFEIYKSFIELIDSDIYILAHATSPFISSKSIENSLIRVMEDYNDSALSVQRKQTFSWFNGKPLNYNPKDVPRTQDIEPVYIETSGFFIFKKNIFKDHGRRIGFNPYFQEVDYFEAIDIDTKEDYEFALKLMI